MTIARMKVAALAFAAAFALATPAMAAGGEYPDADELQAITALLQKQGYTSWESIEFDDGDGGWEVDDATGPDGQEVDLLLDPETHRILRAE